MIPGLSTQSIAKPVIKKRTFGTKFLPAGAKLNGKESNRTADDVKRQRTEDTNGTRNLFSSPSETSVESSIPSLAHASNSSTVTSQQVCSTHATVASNTSTSTALSTVVETVSASTKDNAESSHEQDSSKQRFRFAVVCACNMNRSMAAHKLFQENGFNVLSYGSARQVKLPGNKSSFSADFGDEYQSLLDRIMDSDTRSWAEERGILDMLRRNIRIKPAPERWQQIPDPSIFDIVICFTERVFEDVNEDLRSREPTGKSRTLHVINIETRDDTETAEIGAKYALAFAEMVAAIHPTTDLNDAVYDMLAKMEELTGSEPLHMEHTLI